MAWLKVETNTPDKPEVWAMSETLSMDADMVFGKLFRVWRWFDEHTEEGNARGVTTALVDRIAGVTGFASAMSAVGWLNVTDEGIVLPNFDKHNGESAKKRANTAVRVAKHKKNAKCNAHSVTEELAGELPREEKRREEHKTEGTNSVRSEPAEIATANSLARAVDLSVAMRESGIESNPSDPRLQSLADQGVSADTMRAAAGEAKRAKPNERISPGYVISIVQRWSQEAKRLDVAGATSPKASRHNGFDKIDYREGVAADGSF